MDLKPAPHLPPKSSIKQVMLEVLLALIPAALVYVWFFGFGLVIHLLLACASAVAFEAIMLKLRGKSVAVFLNDYSAVVAGVLLAFAIPPLAPWWITVLGTGFAIVIAKHLYGGLGHNVFNPAMAGYVMLLLAFPLEMSYWVPPDVEDFQANRLSLIQTVWTIFASHPPETLSFDAVTGATALDYLKTGQADMLTMAEMETNPLFGGLGARGWEWSALAFAVGGAYLLFRGIIRWHIPLSMLGSLFVMAWLFHLADSDLFVAPSFHLFSGAAMIGAFFIATDPVSAATSVRGRLIYGAGIGVLTYALRTWGAYPDGVAFAVLIMNIAVPLIDHYTVPRIYGHGRR